MQSIEEEPSQVYGHNFSMAMMFGPESSEITGIHDSIFENPFDNKYESQFWVVYKELHSVLPDKAHEALRTELILHLIRKEDIDGAVTLINPTQHPDYVYQEFHTDGDYDFDDAYKIEHNGEECVDEEHWTHPADFSLSLSSKLHIFRYAMNRGELEVVNVLGNLREEAENAGPIELGEYLLEELRLGMRVHENLDYIAAIRGHDEGSELDTREAVGELAVNLYADGDSERLRTVLDLDTDGSVPMDPTAKMFIGIHERGVQLSDLTARRKKIVRGQGELPSRGRIQEIGNLLSMNGSLSANNAKVGKYIPEFYQCKPEELGPVGPLMLVATDDHFTERVISEGHNIEKVYQSFQAASSGVKQFFIRFHPGLIDALDQYKVDEMKRWHNNFISPNPEPDINHISGKKQSPDNIYSLKVYSQDGSGHRPSARRTLSNLSFLSENTGEAEEDYIEASNILAELEISETELGTYKLMEGDTVDRMRHQTRGNQVYKALQERAVRINDVVVRLPVLFEIYIRQIKHDSDSGDSAAEGLQQSVIEAAKECLNTPLAKLHFTTEQLATIKKAAEGDLEVLHDL